jgi:hypothetical protein
VGASVGCCRSERTAVACTILQSCSTASRCKRVALHCMTLITSENARCSDALRGCFVDVNVPRSAVHVLSFFSPLTRLDTHTVPNETMRQQAAVLMSKVCDPSIDPQPLTDPTCVRACVRQAVKPQPLHTSNVKPSTLNSHSLNPHSLNPSHIRHSQPNIKQELAPAQHSAAQHSTAQHSALSVNSHHDCSRGVHAGDE